MSAQSQVHHPGLLGLLAMAPLATFFDGKLVEFERFFMSNFSD